SGRRPIPCRGGISQLSRLPGWARGACGRMGDGRGEGSRPQDNEAPKPCPRSGQEFAQGATPPRPALLARHRGPTRGEDEVSRKRKTHAMLASRTHAVAQKDRLHRPNDEPYLKLRWCARRANPRRMPSMSYAEAW